MARTCRQAAASLRGLATLGPGQDTPHRNAAAPGRDAPPRRAGRVTGWWVLAALALIPRPVSAQVSDALLAKMDAMQRQILSMQREIADLRHRAGAGRPAAADTRSAGSAQPSARQASLPAAIGNHPPPNSASGGAPPAVAAGAAPDLRGRNAVEQHLQDVTRKGGPGGPPAESTGRPSTVLANGLFCGGSSFAFGVLCFTPGGFLELATVNRSRNLVSDVPSDFNATPFGYSLLAHERELRFTARQSRLSGLLETKINPNLELSAYYEFDFLGASVTSNTRESNSYVPRLRQAFGQIDSLDSGWTFLAGQTWSLATTNTRGLYALDVQLPVTIDSQFVPGFDWLRVPQIRVTKELVPGAAAALSLEAPQSVLPPSPFAAPDGIDVNYDNPGNQGGFLNSATTYSNSLAPDIVGKVAIDPGYGHYELKGSTRFFSDRVVGRTNAAVGYGIGAAATLPIMAKLDLQASGMIGHGIGRYGTTLLPDIALRSDGSVVAIPALHGLVGLVGHPREGTELYAYAGLEQEARAGALGTAGYGSPTLVVDGCGTEGAPATACQAETRRIWQVTGGLWHDLYRGDFGRVVAGAQVAYTQRDAFRGSSGSEATTSVLSGLTSLRYFPF